MKCEQETCVWKLHIDENEAICTTACGSVEQKFIVSWMFYYLFEMRFRQLISTLCASASIVRFFAPYCHIPTYECFDMFVHFLMFLEVCPSLPSSIIFLLTFPSMILQHFGAAFTDFGVGICRFDFFFSYICSSTRRKLSQFGLQSFQCTTGPNFSQEVEIPLM